MPRPKPVLFTVPSQDPEFLKTQEEMSSGDELLSKLKGEPQEVVGAKVESVPAARASPMRESRLTVFLPPEVHHKLRVHAVSEGTTITEFIRELLTRQFAD